MSTFTDAFGDTLDVHVTGGKVFLDFSVAASDGSEDYAFDPDDAASLADAIYAAAGKSAPNDAVRASEVPLNEALIRVAAAHNAHIRFRYAKGPSAPVETREFAPVSVKVLPDHVTFVGFDSDRNAMRSFRSDRIKGQVEVVSV